MGKTYEERSKHLKNMSDEELKEYFWKLTEQVVDPLIDLATSHTSPAIERSILLRMGFSSLEAKNITDKVIDYNLIAKGAGHVVYRYSKLANLNIREAGLKLLNDQGWSEVLNSFGVIHYE